MTDDARQRAIWANVAKGLCGCGAPLRPNNLPCIKCLRAAHERERQRKKDRIKNGLCKECEQPRVNSKYCETHRLAAKGYQTKMYEKRRSAGLCVRCGKKPESTKNCEHCKTEARERYRRKANG